MNTPELTLCWVQRETIAIVTSKGYWNRSRILVYHEDHHQLYVASRQKENKVGCLANIAFQDNSPTKSMNNKVDAYMFLK